MVRAQHGFAERPGPLELADRGPRLADEEIARAERVADVRLDLGLAGEIGGDARLGRIDRLPEGHVLALPILAALGPGRGQNLVAEEAVRHLGLGLRPLGIGFLFPGLGEVLAGLGRRPRGVGLLFLGLGEVPLG